MDGAALEETGKGGGAAPAGVTLEELRKKMADFARERDWEQYHSPRNLLLALVCPLTPVVFFPLIYLAHLALFFTFVDSSVRIFLAD
jgi:hypothetical protein